MIYDYLIIGAGVAGLNAARLIPKNKKVLILCKKTPWECNTFYAQGGVATAVDKNDIQSHIKDTLTAGVNHNNVEAVKVLSEHSRECINDLIDNGLKFDLNKSGDLAFTKEAAHEIPRILHCDGDATGRMLHLFLLEQSYHQIISNVVVNDLLIQDGICYGAKYYDEDDNESIVYANNVLIASGGIGSIYKYHTNSPAVAGELQGICLEKGIELKDMEMMQFHPTVFKGTSFARKTLLSEALRGEGAWVVDEDNKRFLFDYHKDGELAPRDVVSRSIFDYNEKTNKQIFLSFETFSEEFFKNRFPNIHLNLHDLGYDLPAQRVPISPAFHYAMGGVKIDLKSKVINMKNLYAIGEVSCSGLHGANRLASNSLLEGLVFSKIAVDDIEKNHFKINKEDFTKKIISHKRNQNIDKKIKNDLRILMWKSASISRNKADLEDALVKINKFLEEKLGRLLFLRLLTAKSILESALKREYSLGAHYIKENKC